MSKRVFEVAKELGLASKELVERIKELGIDDSVSSTLSTISDDKVSELKAALAEASTSRGEEQTLTTGVVRRRARRRPEAEANSAPPAKAEQDVEESEPTPAEEPASAPKPRSRFATVATRDAGDSSRVEPKAEEPAAVVETPAPAAVEEVQAPATKPRSRFATVETRADLRASEEAPQEAVVETRVTETVVTPPEPPAAVVAEEAAPEAEAPVRRRRFATVVTRRPDETPEPVKPVEVVAAPVPEASAEPSAPVRRFATVVTRDESGAAKRSPIELAELARREADAAASRSKGGATILGQMDPELLSQRTEARRDTRGPAAPGERREARGPAAPAGPTEFGANAAAGAGDRRGRKGKRVVQSGELYGKFNRGGKGGKKGGKRQTGQSTRQTTAAEHKRVVRMEEAILVSELAHQMGVKAGEIVMKLAFDLGLRGANINTPIDFSTASLIAEQYNHKVEQVGFDMSDYLPTYDNSEESLLSRPPVVTVMGHVDHGKTSLLDAIRNTGKRVSAGEAGGITQHIGAYKVVLDENEICFLDTPGHEAFTALRARGAKATDIVILVVAGDDGIMPQTIEAINHAREANVPIIVAITKMDKPSADPQRIRLALTEYGLIGEDIGGDTQFIEVSAMKHTGIDTLLESVLLQAEVMELRANPNRKADGLAIESRLDVGRGPIATVLVQGGTLRVGDIVVIGQHYGRVRSMTDEFGASLTQATPSTPVEITGLSGVPVSGEHFYVVEEEKSARAIAEHVGVQAKQAELAQSATSGMRASSGSDLDSFMSQDDKELKVIVKADVQGSVEAVVQAIQKLANEQVRVRVIHSGVGSITESDVNLATSSNNDSNVLIVGFNIRPEQRAVTLADHNGVRILSHSVIYDVLDEVRAIMGGLLDPVFEEEVIGHAEVRMVFQNSKVGAVAGCMVLDGLMRRNAHARVVRDHVVVFTSTIGSLRNVDRDEREMKAGFECGLSVERFSDFKNGDIVECFIVHERKATLI